MVDVTSLQHADDMKNDSFGRWEHSGSHIVPFHTRVNEDHIEIEKCAPGATGSDIYYLRRLHSATKTIEIEKCAPGATGSDIYYLRRLHSATKTI